MSFLVISALYPIAQHSARILAPNYASIKMDGGRTISESKFGDDNVIIQGSVIVNSLPQGSRRQGENDVLRFLYKSPYQDQKDRNAPRVPGTCDWFVSHKHFRTWNESNSSTMLWVSADPGCGKSVLVRYLIDSVLKTTKSRTVCYFFFKDDFVDQKNIINALSCILRQIFIQKPSLLTDEILKKFNTGGETFYSSFSELWQILMQVAEDKNSGEIICLLDAIDECEDQSGQGRSQLFKALCTLYGSESIRSSNLKFLLTSRPYVDIYRNLQPLRIPGLPVIHLNGESEDEIKKISLEINTYINARVKDIGERLHLTQDECDLLLQKLMSVPNRTYLWVYLVLDFIENSINVNNMMIIEATSTVPTTVNEAYERILSKSSNARQAREVLHIIVAAARPLTLREMHFALASEKGDHQSYDDLGLIPDDRFHETLRNICGLCVVVVDSKVYLLHQTAKEFLIKSDIAQIMGTDRGGRKWKSSLEPQESHRVLAEICIWHLLAGLKMIFGSSTQHNWREIFLDYSAKHWASHFRQTTAESQSMMTKLVLMICDANSSCCQTWFSIYWTTTNTKFPDGFTTLMLASYFGLDFAVSNLLTMADIKLNTRDSVYQRSALSWAVRNGFHTVTRLLLDGIWKKLGTFRIPFKKKAKVNLQDKYGRTPLTYAVWNRDVALVQLLIKAGARARLRDKVDGTPLSYAFCNGNAHIIDLLAKQKREVDIENDINRLLRSAAGKGHEEVVAVLLNTNRANIEERDLRSQTPLILAADERYETIVKLLLEAGADVNAHDEYGETALIKASFHGCKTTMELLLAAGADANVHGNDGLTALMMASGQGFEAAAKLLLESGADVNTHNNNGRTALIYASCKGSEVTAKLLLNSGADVNEQDSSGQTALINASWKGSEATAMLLLESGADVNAHDNNGQTALMWASDNGNDETVKLLLKSGADVNARDNSGQTPLIGASENGNDATVKLLLESGGDVNVCNTSGETALMGASKNGSNATVQLLLDSGADVSVQDSSGRTALTGASEHGHKLIERMLRSKGAYLM